MRKKIQILAWILAISGFVISIYFVVSAASDGLWIWGKGKIDFGKTGEFGDFIGGFVGTMISAAGFIFLYLTLVEQREAFIKERFESRFLELINFHRSNVSELHLKTYLMSKTSEGFDIEKSECNGKEVFNLIFNQFVQLRNELKSFFDVPEAEIFEDGYLKVLKQNADLKVRKFKLLQLAQLDICYSIVFYGAASEGALILQNLFAGKYKAPFVNIILRYVSLKPIPDSSLWSKWVRLSKRNSIDNRISITKEIFLERKKKRLSPSLVEITEPNSKESIIQGYHNDFVKYYGGHQFRLGHYFRHLFQTVNYVNDHEILSYKEKYGYIKILRAQFSTYEQAIIFLNSLSKLGYVWELFPEQENSMTNKEKVNKQLITKYNLIKNLPGESLYGIHFKRIYPNIEYEGGDYKRDNSLYN